MHAARPILQIFGLTLIVLLCAGCSGMQSVPTSTSLPLIATPAPPTAVSPTPTPSPVLLAESLAKQYVSAFEARDADKYFALHSDDALYVDYGVGTGRATKAQVYCLELQALFRYVESFEVRITSYIVSADGRFVVLQGTYTDWGKSGFPYTVPMVVIVEIRDGKIVQETAYYDGSPFKKQGVVNPTLENQMRTRCGIAVIVVAVIWAAVILATSMVLDGTLQSGRVLQILGGGAAATIILLGGMATREKKAR